MKHITEHFKWTELICPCCERIKVVDSLFDHMEMIEALRIEAGFRITVNSGYRCRIHNAKVGGRVRSQHLFVADDIRPTDGDKIKVERIHIIAVEMDFGGIGKYETFNHLDPRKKRARWTG